MQECVLAREGCCFVGECWSEPGRNVSSAWGRDVGMARTLWGHSTSPSYQTTFPAIKFGYCHCRMLDFPPGDLQKSGLFFQEKCSPYFSCKVEHPWNPCTGNVPFSSSNLSSWPEAFSCRFWTNTGTSLGGNGLRSCWAWTWPLWRSQPTVSANLTPHRGY